MLKIVILIIFLLLPISIFSDVTIINKDDISYKLFIEKENSAEHTAIGAKTKAVASQSDCKILIKKNKNFIKAVDEDIILIKDGKLSKKNKEDKKEEDKKDKDKKYKDKDKNKENSNKENSNKENSNKENSNKENSNKK